MRKKFLVLTVVATLLAAMTACGSSEGAKESTSVNNEASKKEDKEVSTKEKEADKKENDSTEKPDDTNKEESNKKPSKNNVTPVKESEAVINIGGVKVKLDQTWEEFKQLMADNGWTINSINSEDRFPTDDKHKGGGYIDTNIGQVRVWFMANKENNGAVLRYVELYPGYLTSLDADICGITFTATPEELSKVLEFAEESPDGVSYKLDDWVTIALLAPNEETGLSTIKIERATFNQRTE